MDSEIVVPDHFPPGSIMVFATQMLGMDRDLDSFCKAGLEEAFVEAGLDWVDLNVLLFRADGEEKDATGANYPCSNSDGLEFLTFPHLSEIQEALLAHMMFRITAN